MTFGFTGVTVLISSLARLDFYLYCSSSVFSFIYLFHLQRVSSYASFFFYFESLHVHKVHLAEPSGANSLRSRQQPPLRYQKMDNGHAHRLSDIDKHISCNSFPSSFRSLFFYYLTRHFFFMSPSSFLLYSIYLYSQYPVVVSCVGDDVIW